MIEDIRYLIVFAKIVQAGSISGGTEASGVSAATACQHLSRLEKNLGTALLYRNTRKLSLTADGAKLLDLRNGVSRGSAGVEPASVRRVRRSRHPAAEHQHVPEHHQHQSCQGAGAPMIVLELRGYIECYDREKHRAVRGAFRPEAADQREVGGEADHRPGNGEIEQGADVARARIECERGAAGKAIAQQQCGAERHAPGVGLSRRQPACLHRGRKQVAHRVPPSAQVSPWSVAASGAWPVTCGQNSNNRPASPSVPPAITCGAISRRRISRASKAFHSVDVENTTATRPLGMVRLAFRKQTKFRQNRQSPCAAINLYDAAGGRRSVFFHPSSTNRMIAASAKR